MFRESCLWRELRLWGLHIERPWVRTRCPSTFGLNEALRDNLFESLAKEFCEGVAPLALSCRAMLLRMLLKSRLVQNCPVSVLDPGAQTSHSETPCRAVPTDCRISGVLSYAANSYCELSRRMRVEQVRWPKGQAACQDEVEPEPSLYSTCCQQSI